MYRLGVQHLPLFSSDFLFLFSYLTAVYLCFTTAFPIKLIFASLLFCDVLSAKGVVVTCCCCCWPTLDEVTTPVVVLYWKLGGAGPPPLPLWLCLDSWLPLIQLGVASVLVAVCNRRGMILSKRDFFSFFT